MSPRLPQRSPGQRQPPYHRIEIRERLGLLPNSEVEFEIDGAAVRIKKARGRKANSRGRSLVQRMTGKATSGLSTEQIMALTRGSA